MKKFLFISMIAALICASSSVSQANASHPKAGIEKVGFSPPVMVTEMAVACNITNAETYSPVGPAQTLVLCDKGTTATTDKGYASEVKVNTSKREATGWNYIRNTSGSLIFDSGATGRNPRDELWC